MPTQIFGVENLKKIIKFSCDLTKQIAEALKDKKFTWTEGFGFIDEAMQIPGIAKSLPEIKKELSELSADERQHLNDYFAAEFDIENDKVEWLIEHSLHMAISIIALVEEWKSKENEGNL